MAVLYLNFLLKNTLKFVFLFSGTFQGQWMRGMRHGYGVRTSATFGLASHYRPSARGSLSSIPASEQADPAGDRDRKIDDFRGGFVLKSRSDEPPTRRRSLVEKSTNLKKSILQVCAYLYNYFIFSMAITFNCLFSHIPLKSLTCYFFINLCVFSHHNIRVSKSKNNVVRVTSTAAV